MTQLERDELVERYLAGTMAPREVEEFRASAASDPELQQTLKAQEIVRTAILHEVEEVPEEASYHAALMGLLAATPAAVGTGVGVGAAASGAGSSAGAAATGGLASLGAAKIIGGLLIAGGLTLGTVMIVNVKKESGVGPAMQPHVQQAPPTVPMQPPTPTPSAQTPPTTPAPTNIAPRESSNTARAQQDVRLKAQSGKNTGTTTSQNNAGRKDNTAIDGGNVDQSNGSSVEVGTSPKH